MNYRAILLGNYSIGSYIGNITLSSDGNRAFVGTGSSGFQIIDVSNPSSPTLLGSYDRIGGGFGGTTNIILTSNESKAFVTNIFGILELVDISKLDVPILIRNYDKFNLTFGATLSDDENTIFVIDGASGLRIIDISKDTLPKLQNFTDDTIELKIYADKEESLILNVTTDRDDIISIGDYESKLFYADYDDEQISIPISSIEDAVGQTVITVTLSHGEKIETRTIYLNVHSP